MVGWFGGADARLRTALQLSDRTVRRMPWILARRIVAVFLAGLSLLVSALVAIIIITSGPLIERTVENSDKILQEFQELAKRIEAIRLLPLEERRERAKYIPRIERDIEILVPDEAMLSQLVMDEDFPKNHEFDADCLVLRTWRGEWYEYYIIPSGQTSVNPSYWNLFITNALAAAFCAVIAVSLAFLARVLWRKPTSDFKSA